MFILLIFKKAKYMFFVYTIGFRTIKLMLIAKNS